MAHPFELASDAIAQELVRQQSILCLPGTMFRPKGDASGAQELRIAFANVDAAGVKTLFDRLEKTRA